MSRKLPLLVAASLVWTSSAAIAQTGPNPAPQPEPPAAETTPPPRADRMDTSTGGIFQSDLMFMLAAIAGAVLLAFAATQIGGDEPESP